MRVKFWRWVALIAVLATIAACGDDDDPEPEAAPPSTDETTDEASEPVEVMISLGSLKIANTAPQVDTATFAEHGVTLDVQYAASGAAIVPGVIGGSYDIGYGSVVSVVQSVQQGLPIRIIAGGDISVGELVVLADSGIEDAAGLEGRTVATNALKSTVDLSTSVAVDDRGGDASSLKFIEVPFPGQLAALDGGSIDAAVLPEPFLSQAKADPKYRSLFSVFDVEPTDMTNCYFASEKFLEENPQAAEQFADAISAANDKATSDEEAARAAVSTVTGAPPQAIANIGLPTWLTGSVDEEAIATVVDRMVEHGLLEEGPSVDEIVWQRS